MDKGLYSQLTLALNTNDKRHRQHADQENDFVHSGAWKKEHKKYYYYNMWRHVYHWKVENEDK